MGRREEEGAPRSEVAEQRARHRADPRSGVSEERRADTAREIARQLAVSKGAPGFERVGDRPAEKGGQTHKVRFDEQVSFDLLGGVRSPCLLNHLVAGSEDADDSRSTFIVSEGVGVLLYSALLDPPAPVHVIPSRLSRSCLNQVAHSIVGEIAIILQACRVLA